MEIKKWRTQHRHHGGWQRPTDGGPRVRCQVDSQVGIPADPAAVSGCQPVSPGSELLAGSHSDASERADC